MTYHIFAPKYKIYRYVIVTVTKIVNNWPNYQRLVHVYIYLVKKYLFLEHTVFMTDSIEFYNIENHHVPAL